MGVPQNRWFLLGKILSRNRCFGGKPHFRKAYNYDLEDMANIVTIHLAKTGGHNRYPVTEGTDPPSSFKKWHSPLTISLMILEHSINGGTPNFAGWWNGNSYEKWNRGTPIGHLQESLAINPAGDDDGPQGEDLPKSASAPNLPNLTALQFKLLV